MRLGKNLQGKLIIVNLIQVSTKYILDGSLSSVYGLKFFSKNGKASQLINYRQ